MRGVIGDARKTSRDRRRTRHGGELDASEKKFMLVVIERFLERFLVVWLA